MKEIRGLQVRNSGSSKKTNYDAAMSLFVDGSAARRLDETPSVQERLRREEEEKRRREKARARAQAERNRQAERTRGAARTVAFILAGAVLAGITVLMLSCVVKNNSLSREISSLEATLSELRAQNDSKQYDIDSSVDMNTIILEAGKLGMVRGTAEQIRYYSSSESEFLKKVAEIPTD